MGDQAAVQVRDVVIDDANLWKAVAGAAVHHLPTIGSSVYYLPNRHRAATGNAAPAGLNEPILQPERIGAVVENMELRAREEDVYVRYYLRTVDEANHGVEGGVLPGLDAGVIVRIKWLTSTDVQPGQDYCAISEDLAATLLPEPSPEDFPGLKSADQYIPLVGVHGDGFELLGKYNFSSSTYKIGKGWPALKTRHGLQSGDCVVFTKSNEADVEWKFGMRRRSNGARVTAAEVDAAFEAATRGDGVVFPVDYYPGRMMQDEYVVLRRSVDGPFPWDNQTDEVLYRSWDNFTHGTAIWRMGTIRNRLVDESSSYFNILGPGIVHDGVRPWKMGTIQNIAGDESSPYFNIQGSRILYEGVRPWNLQPADPANDNAI